MRKPKVIRVVTAPYVVQWHLTNTLRRMKDDFDVTVVGQGVSIFKSSSPEVNWVQINIGREVNLIADLRSLFHLCKVFRAQRPDIVHSIMPKAGLLCAIAGFICRVPVRLHTFTGQLWANKRFPVRQLLYLIDRLILLLNTECLSDSPSQSELLRQHRISFRGMPLRVLGKGSLSGVDVARFDIAKVSDRAASLRTELGIDDRDFVFAFVARKSRDKGALDMIGAFARIVNLHPHAKLLFVGPDESNGELRSIRAVMPDAFNGVIDIGKVDHHEAYLAISDVLCLPSYREGFGSIVIDAAAMGVPAIGTRIAGLVDSIEDGKTGVLVPAGDISKFAEAMLSMIEDPPRRIKMGVAARHRVEADFTADKLYASLRDYYLSQCAATIVS